MRRFFAIVCATGLEVLSEPLAYLLMMSSLAMATIMPAMHYHQFGEPSRMARDAGLSSFLIGSLFFAIFLAVKIFRREIESGTMQMALAHSVSRATFFSAKVCGLFFALLLFVTTLFATLTTVVNGAEIGGRVAAKCGEIYPIWGRSFALAISVIVLPPIVAAAMNRFLNCRWTLSASVLSLLIAIATVFYRFDFLLFKRLLPVATMLIFPAIIFATIASAAAVRYRENAALAITGIFFVATLPLLGNYYLSDVLAKGGALAWSHVAIGFAASCPLAIAFAMTGILLLERRDVGGGE